MLTAFERDKHARLLRYHSANIQYLFLELVDLGHA